MKKTAAIDENVLEWVHFDLKHWDPTQRLDQDIPDHTFSPNTLVHLQKTLAADRRAQELIAIAQTPDWSPQYAEELFERLKAWLSTQVRGDTQRKSNSHAR